VETPTALSDEVRIAVQRTYPDWQQQEVLEHLTKFPNEWERQSILVLANGDYARLCELIVRDELEGHVIQLGIDPQAHGGLSSEELLARRTKMGLSLPETFEETAAQKRRQDVLNFIAETLIFPIDRLSDSTRLQTELVLSGLRGDRFVRAFSERFKVDLNGYEPHLYFAQQPGDNFWDDIKAIVFGRKQANILPIDVHDLLVAAETHKWKIDSNNAR
jgi:hypothetical protein